MESSSPKRRKHHHHQLPKTVIVVTDAGQDCDDEFAIMMLFYLLYEHNLGECVGIIACLHPANSRAKLVKKLIELVVYSFPNKNFTFPIPNVAVGLDGPEDISLRNEYHDFFLQDSYANHSDPQISLKAEDLFLSSYENAENQSITIINLANLTDVANFAKKHCELFKTKTKEIITMGGCLILNDILIPDDTAHNNALDCEAAKQVYAMCMEFSIPMLIFSRFATWGLPIPVSTIDDLALTGNPIAVRIKNALQKDLRSLWERSRSDDPIIRKGLPDRCNKEWFLKSYCMGHKSEDENNEKEEDIWLSIKQITLSDVFALACVFDFVVDTFFSPKYIKVNQATHRIVGFNENERCIQDQKGMTDFVISALTRMCQMKNTTTTTTS